MSSTRFSVTSSLSPRYPPIQSILSKDSACFDGNGPASSVPLRPPHLLEELGHLAHQAGVALHLALVSVGQEEVAQQRRVRERLDDAVHEARVAQVDETPQT